MKLFIKTFTGLALILFTIPTIKPIVPSFEPGGLRPLTLRTESSSSSSSYALVAPTNIPLRHAPEPQQMHIQEGQPILQGISMPAQEGHLPTDRAEQARLITIQQDYLTVSGWCKINCRGLCLCTCEDVDCPNTICLCTIEDHRLKFCQTYHPRKCFHPTSFCKVSRCCMVGYGLAGLVALTVGINILVNTLMNKN